MTLNVQSVRSSFFVEEINGSRVSWLGVGDSVTCQLVELNLLLVSGVFTIRLLAHM